MARLMKGYTLLEMTVTLAIIAILAAVSIPNLMILQAKAKQSEVKSNLKAAYVAEKAFLQEKDRYSSFVMEIGFAPERNNRYAYFFDATTVVLDNRASTVPVTPVTADGISVDVFKGYSPINVPPASPCSGIFSAGIYGATSSSIVISSAGNIDSDATNDLWTVSTDSRTTTPSASCTAPANIAAGEPANDQDDTRL